MNRFISAAAIALTASLALAGQASAQSRGDEQRFQDALQRFQNEQRVFQSEYDRYLAARDRYSRDYPPPPPPGYNDDRYEGGYDPSRYYRQGPNYQPRALASDDRVYRGSDGRYYCKRNDGTTGLIVGAAGGALLGNVIDGGHSRAVGTLLGGAIGALAGRSVEQSSKPITCQ